MITYIVHPDYWRKNLEDLGYHITSREGQWPTPYIVEAEDTFGGQWAGGGKSEINAAADLLKCLLGSKPDPYDTLPDREGELR